MRITIDVSGDPGSGDQGSVTTPNTSTAPSADETSVPPEVAARAAAEGGMSAGRAPAEAMTDGPAVFTNEPGTPESTPTGGPTAPGGQSGGSAPAFLTGATLDEVQVDSEA